ncbi:hypothetical protein C6499_01550 [Candidatus Poribacteria bacterium]|nr:MAG: hypothetical protein C6499_01550 [Candidatus Poribacteria bacterium]
MKILATGLLILVMMSGHLNADDHSATNDRITLNLDSTSEVSVKGFIAPVEESLSDDFKQWDALVNLRVAEPEKQHSASVFQAFLPKEPVSVGDLWIVDMLGVLALFKQLHPKPNFFLHINSGDSFGLWACLRAYNDQYADIVFRIHAEFRLKDGWFTPSQFTGHLVIDRIEEKVAFFEMYVPKGVINFDVNWKRDNASYHITSTGFCPKMELRAGNQELLESIKFTESITQAEVERALILRFYKSQQINWVPLAQVLEKAIAQQKPIHVISIDGPLIDESC